MPGIDGFTAFEQIREIDPKVKVMFVTGYSLQEPATEVLPAGASTVVTRPVDPTELVTLMRTLTAQEVLR